jgi:uncharacterized protein YjdB
MTLFPYTTLFRSIAVITPGENGKAIITAKERGRTTIRAKSLDGGKTAEAVLIVEGGNDVTSVSLPGSLEIVNGKTAGLTATLSPVNATNPKVSWESSDPATVAILSVSDDGLTATLKALQLSEMEHPALVTVTTEDGGFTAVSEVTVVGPTLIESVSLNTETLSVGEGGASILTAVITPDNATDQELEWTSSDSTVAGVTPNEGGKSATVTGIKSGTATITVTSVEGNKTAECVVKVIEVRPITEVTLPETLEISVSGTGTLTAALTPSDTTENITWTSSDESIVTVTNTPGDPATTLSGKKAGTATVTATSPNGISDTCTVSVGYKLVARTLKESPTTGTTPDGEVLFWGANDEGIWSKGGGEALVLKNAESNGSIGVVNGTLPNVTLVYLENPVPAASSYTFRAKVSVSSSGGTAGFIMGAMHDAAAYAGTAPIYTVGLRFTGNPAIRRVMRTRNATATLRADQISSPNPSNPVLGTEYIYEIAWNGTAKEYTLTYTAGETAYSATLKRGTGDNDINDTLLDEAAYYPGFIIGNNTITISEITLTVE